MKLLFTGKYLLFKTREKRCQPYLHLHFHSCSQENGLPSHLRGDISLSCQDQNKPSSKAASSPAARTLGLFIMRLALDSFTWHFLGLLPAQGAFAMCMGFPCLLDWETPLGPLLRLTLQVLPSQPFFLSPLPDTARCACLEHRLFSWHSLSHMDFISQRRIPCTLYCAWHTLEFRWSLLDEQTLSPSPWPKNNSCGLELGQRFYLQEGEVWTKCFPKECSIHFSSINRSRKRGSRIIGSASFKLKSWLSTFNQTFEILVETQGLDALGFRFLL